MRKALILTVLALFGSESLAQHSFRHAPTVALDDAQDNNMMMMKFERPSSSPPPFNPSSRFDDFADDILLSPWEIDDLMDPMVLNRWAITGVPPNSFQSENPSFLGSGNSGVFVQGGNAPQGGVQATGSGQFIGPIGSTGAQYVVGATVSHNPGSPVAINPHVAVKIPF